MTTIYALRNVQDMRTSGEAGQATGGPGLNGAGLQLEVNQQHRGAIRAARELAITLMGQLATVAGNREAVVEALNEFTEPGPRRVAMVRAVQLQSHAVAVRDLATALRQLILVEREVLGIADVQLLEPHDPRDPVDHIAERTELAELEAAIEAQLARVAPTAERVG